LLIQTWLVLCSLSLYLPLISDSLPLLSRLTGFSLFFFSRSMFTCVYLQFADLRCDLRGFIAPKLPTAISFRRCSSELTDVELSLFRVRFPFSAVGIFVLAASICRIRECTIRKDRILEKEFMNSYEQEQKN